MKTFLLTAFCFLFIIPAANAQYRGKGYTLDYRVEANGDTVFMVKIAPIFVFKRKADRRRHSRLVENLKIVYPIAKEANTILQNMEAHLETLHSEKERKAYTKSMEKMLKEQFTPIIRKLTFSQGKILIKLIDRETSRTSYSLVKELRGSFSAFLWQGVARIFGANLKDTYDKDGEDWVIEQLIILYENGLL